MFTFRRFLNCLASARGTDVGLLILRVAVGCGMLTHGLAKIGNFTELSQTFSDPLGVGSHASLMLIIFAEFVCAVFVICGFLTRLAVIPIIVSMIVAAFFTFPQFAFGQSEKALLYLIVFVVLLFTGAGRYSLDRLAFGSNKSY